MKKKFVEEGGGWWEEIPYDKCPNCKKYSYRRIATLFGLFSKKKGFDIYGKICKNCRLGE